MELGLREAAQLLGSLMLREKRDCSGKSGLRAHWETVLRVGPEETDAQVSQAQH